jgi:hypothetical protein
MKTFIKIFIPFIIILITTIFLIAYFFWLGYPKHKINILVLDKTVPTYDRIEHKSLFWVLNNARITKRNGDSYSYKEDYYGFFPLKPDWSRKYEIKRILLEQIDSLTDLYDAAYYADTYGVYYKEWLRGFHSEDDNALIEGGLNQNDYLFIKKMSEKKKLIIAEYNTLLPPTSELIKFKTQELFGLTSTGWYGKYFKSLDTSGNKDLPSWIPEKYKYQSNGKWLFNGPGIVIVNSNNNIIVVLDAKHCNKDKYPIIETSENFRDKYHLPEHINYHNWFEIVSASDTFDVISNYSLPVNESGDSLLNAYSIPAKFPAVLSYTKSSNNIYYFAGNFANNPIMQFYSCMANSRRLISFFADNHKDFFLRYYFPLVETIFVNFSENNKKKGEHI